MSLMILEKSTGVQSPAEADADGNLNVNVAAGSVTATVDTGATADMDSGAGTQTVDIIGIALPASGGAVAGGTSTNPIRTDPTGTTAQPVTDNGGSLTVDGAVSGTGSAGTAATGVITVQGIASMTPVQATVAGSIAHDAAAAAIAPNLIGGYASAAAPASVSTDVDSVRSWFLPNGAQATVVTAAGALIGGDAANGLDVDVTRLPALAAGTNNIGDVDVLTIAAGDNNIGNVDIVTLPDVDDTAFTPATSTGAVIMAFADETTPDAVDEGDKGALRMTLQRGLHANLRDASGTELGTSASPLHVRPGDGTSSVELLAAGADANANTLNQLITADFAYLFNGTTWDRVRGDTTNGLDVDVTRLPVAATATLSNVASSATSVTLLAANAERKSFIIYNDSNQRLLMKYGATASATSFSVPLAPGEVWKDDGIRCTVIIDGIWDSANGNARMTEFT